MKKLLPFSWLLPAIIVLFSGCLKDKVSRTYQIMRPVYEDKAVVYNNIKSGPVQHLSRPGKIYIRGNYLYVNEIDKGIHIFENTDPTHPRAISFIKIPGNLDIAVSGQYLYADMYTDLLTIDIGDPLNARIVDSSANVFPDRNFQMGWYPDGNKIIVGWIIKDTTITDEPNVNWWGGGCAACDFVAVPQFSSGAAKANYVPGISGSMARFVTVNSYLYAVSTSSLMVYDISNASDPQKGNELQVGWNLETIFPFANNLFIGSRSGMFIYSISDPSNPQQLSNYQHVTSCDPVISDGDYAFVTLRSGTACEGFTNQLDVLNINNILNPQLVKSYPMHNPHGLGKDGNTLFICDGTDGVKIYNAQDVLNISLIHQIENLNAYDAIPWEGRLIVTAEDGIHQYDYSDLHNIRSLSTIYISGE
jgi:hypothetical protein